MEATNNILYFMGDPYTRYKTAVPYNIAGKRVDKNKNVITFILSFGSHEKFEYERHVLEVYSEEEDKFVRSANKHLFETGALVPYVSSQEHRFELPNNALDDEEVERIALLASSQALKSELNAITSPITVERILRCAKDNGRSSRIISVIEQRLKELTDVSNNS